LRDAVIRITPVSGSVSDQMVGDADRMSSGRDVVAFEACSRCPISSDGRHRAFRIAFAGSKRHPELEVRDSNGWQK